MKQKTKFKQTEIGKIPGDWEVEKIGDCCKLVKKQYKPNRENNKKYVGLEHIEQGNLKLCGIGNSSDVVSNKFIFEKGQILFGKLRPYFRKVFRPNFDGVCSTDIWVIDSNEGFDNNFLFYFFADKRIIDEATNSSEGTRMPRAKWDYLSELEFEFPPLPQQQAIAKILSSLDSKIELNNKMNKTLEAIGQALFKKWFIDLEKIPKGWETKSLEKIADFLNGLALQKYPAKEKESLPVIKIRELKQGITANTDRADVNIPSEYIVDDGDILFSWSGSLEVVIWGQGKGALNQHLFKITSKDYPKWFYYFWTKYHLPEFKHIAAGKATTMGHIKRHHLEEAMCIIPDKKSLNNMTKIFEPIIERQIKNLIEIRKLSKIRDLLLPKLMSGKVRVPMGAK